MAATTALREALNQGISSGNLIDTKIISYSHRDSSGRVCQPRALYTSSRVLKTIPYFNDREYTATLDITRGEPHTIVSKYSSGTSQNLSLETSTKRSTKKNLQKTTVICPTATLRTMRTKSSFRPSRKSSRRLVRPTLLRFPERSKKLPAKSMRNVLTRGRWSKSRTWRS